MEAIVVERTIWIGAPRERVWQAITTPEQIMRWWGDHWEISALEVGGIVKFGDPNDLSNLMSATIDTLEPPHRFTILWPPQEQYHGISMSTIYLLTEENGGKRVTVRETGFEALPDDVRQKRFDSTSQGYQTVLAGLKDYVEAENK
jgi:uncharacterized protein YndB with AHSA1/START domain